MQIYCSTHSLVLHAMATQYTRSLSSVYYPHWLLQWRRHCSCMLILFFKYISLIMLLQLPHFFSPLYSPLCCTHLPPAFPLLSSCPWVLHISSLPSPLPILFFTFPCVFCTYQLYFLFPVPFPPISPLPLPADNPPCDLHFCDSVPVLVVCLVCFCFCFRFGC